MARPRYPTHSGPLPPPLPPETRTVGQLVAEAIKLYGRRFWPSLALGVGPGAMTVVAAALDQGSAAQLAFLTVAGAVLLTASYVGAVVVASPEPVAPRALLPAAAAGVLAWLPVPFLAFGVVVPLLWLAWIGLAVPAAAREGLGAGEALRRGARLGRADYVHALGALVTLTVVVGLTQSVLFFLLRGQADQTRAWAAFLANVVVSPLLFLGSALLYEDQVARLGRTRLRTRRPDAALHPALDADAAGPADAEREPRPPP